MVLPELEARKAANRPSFYPLFGERWSRERDQVFFFLKLSLILPSIVTNGAKRMGAGNSKRIADRVQKEHSKRSDAKGESVNPP